MHGRTAGHPPNTLDTTRVTRTRRRPSRPRAMRLASGVMVIGLLAVNTAAAPAALALPRGAQVVSQGLQIVASAGSVALCENEQRVLGAAVRQSTRYRPSRGAAIRTTNQAVVTAHTIRARVTDPSVLDAAPPFVQAGGANPVISFNLKGLKRGRTTIELTDNFDPTVRPKTITVVVGACWYEFTTTSTWQHPRGFKPHMYSSITRAEMRASGPDQYSGVASMENVAVGSGTGGCVASFRLRPSNVALKGTLDPHGSSLTVSMTFPFVTMAGTQVSCGVGGGRTDTATPQRLEFRMQAFQSAFLTTPHVLEADVNITGTTDIQIMVVKDFP
jgi:hypothetical protein